MKKPKLDNLGRVVIPKPFRKELNLQEGSTLVVTLENNSVVIRPEKTTCRCCGSFVESNQNFPLCKDCVEQIKADYN